VLTGERDPITMAARLTRHYGTVVLKLGGEGCVLAVPGQAPVRVPAHPARATDTTGAGDAFCGAFLSRWLSGGPHPGLAPISTPAPARDLAPTPAGDLSATAEFAVRIAATVVTRFGARPV
jgi:sugar/nucleoside kinase (ribokinase family)